MDVQLKSPVAVHSFDGWRTAARALLAGQVAPQAVQWLSHKDDAALSAAPALAAPPEPAAPAVRIPSHLMAMLQAAACCRAPNRWAFLYLVLWRWQHGDHHVLSPADADGARLRAMVDAVQAEVRAMQACIRFRERSAEAGAPRFVAWCEPRHDVLLQVAQHFAARLGRVTWMIATPAASVLWDGAVLHSTGPLLRAPDELDDAGAARRLAYVHSIFSPARLQAQLVQGGAPETPATCRRCPLWEHATQAVEGAGPARARIMLVGEQPGDQEDMAGLPFVGPAGKLLERALREAALARRAVYLTNAVKHFKWTPRGKRRIHKTPAQREVEACGVWLDAELARVRPRVVVALGTTALRAVGGDPRATLKDALGQPFQHQGRWIVAAYHPAYVLRVPGADARALAFAVLVDALRQARQLAAQAG